jgi:beta-glucosidase
MTLEEKVGQLNQYNGFWDITGPTQRVKLLKIRRPKKGLVGSMLNVKALKTLKHYRKCGRANRLGIPLLLVLM